MCTHVSTTIYLKQCKPCQVEYSQSILDSPPPLIALNILCHPPLAHGVSAEKLDYSLMGIPLYVICCFSLAVLISSLYSTFAILITVCLGLTLFGLILFGTLCFLDLDICFVSQVKEVFSYYVQMYSLLLSLFSFSGIPIL